MPADAWKAYNSAREMIGNATINLAGHTFKVALFQSTSNCADPTKSVLGDLTNQVANANGYVTGGVTVPVTWTRAGATVTFAITAAAQWTASGGPIAARYAVIYDDTAANKPLLAWALLDNTPADVTVTAGNTVSLNAGNVFTLSGM
jgi:hypothetical protein